MGAFLPLYSVYSDRSTLSRKKQFFSKAATFSVLICVPADIRCRRLRVSHVRIVRLSTFDRTSQGMMNLLGFIMSLVYMQAVHGWLSTYERLVKSQNFFSSYLTQEDLSRFGREYINSGKYIHRLFPVLGVRLIAINDNIDTITRDESSEFSITLKNLMNDNYSRDISVKVRSQLQVKRKHGDFICPFAPYGLSLIHI